MTQDFTWGVRDNLSTVISQPYLRHWSRDTTGNRDRNRERKNIYIYIYIHMLPYIYISLSIKEKTREWGKEEIHICCRVLNWTPFLPPCARSMRKRSAKCVFFFFFRKITQICAAPNGVHLCTHDFVRHFSSFFPPFLGGYVVFALELVHWAPENTGGGRVWPFFPANAGGSAFGATYLGQTLGAEGFSAPFLGCLWVFCSFSFFGRGGPPIKKQQKQEQRNLEKKKQRNKDKKKKQKR